MGWGRLAAVTACHCCGGAGWQVGTINPCAVCAGTGRPDGQLTPHEQMVMGEIERARAARADAVRFELAIFAGLVALLAAFAAALAAV